MAILCVYSEAEIFGRLQKEGRGTLELAYLRFGSRSAMPVMPAMMLPWEIMTPLGIPVEPLVYMMTAMSEGSGASR